LYLGIDRARKKVHVKAAKDRRSRIFENVEFILNPTTRSKRATPTPELRSAAKSF
jgi:hypothetical protein